jgi:hypothetical protein
MPEGARPRRSIAASDLDAVLLAFAIGEGRGAAAGGGEEPEVRRGVGTWMLENGESGEKALGEACVSFPNFAARRGDTLFAI